MSHDSVILMKRIIYLQFLSLAYPYNIYNVTALLFSVEVFAKLIVKLQDIRNSMLM